MDQHERRAYAAKIYEKVADDIKGMSREEMAVILHGFACQAKRIELDHPQRSLYAPGPDIASECPSLNSMHRAMADLRHLAFFDECTLVMDRARTRRAGDASVYVIEFSDGHVKIGQSITPEARIKNIAGGNQATLTRQWISAGIRQAVGVETAAHRHFRSQRVGGEFFKVPFDVAVDWITNQVEQQLALH